MEKILRKNPDKDSISDLGPIFRATYIRVKEKWSYTARSSEVLEMIKFSYEFPEWDLIDFHQINLNMSEFDGWVVDRLIEYRDSKEGIDFVEIWNKIKTFFDFSKSEIEQIELGNIDERLWAIFTAIINPSLEMKY